MATGLVWPNDVDRIPQNLRALGGFDDVDHACCLGVGDSNAQAGSDGHMVAGRTPLLAGLSGSLAFFFNDLDGHFQPQSRVTDLHYRTRRDSAGLYKWTPFGLGSVFTDGLLDFIVLVTH